MITSVRHSNSLILTWQVAEWEAGQLKASTIEPTHLLLGLCKTVDLDLVSLISPDTAERDEVLEECLREVRRLRTVFHEVDLNAAQFRRRLRRISGLQRFGLARAERLHRNDAAKDIFSNAERFAQISQGVLYPIHLLCAVFGIRNEEWDQLLQEFRIRREQLWRAAKSAMFSPHDKAPASHIQWN